MVSSKLNSSLWTRQALVVGLTLATMVCAYLPVAGLQEDAKFVAIEENGVKMWRGGGSINLTAHGTRPLTFKVINTLTIEHGFTIDSMKVKEVIKPGEERTIEVPLADIDKTISAHRVYCHLHPKHMAAAFIVTLK
jgi:hypothetical protein